MACLRKTSNLLKLCFNKNKVWSRISWLSGERGTSDSGRKESLEIGENPLESIDLRSGMRLMCECKDALVTTVGFVVAAGSMHERPVERGASLFLEHLIFKRTKCRTGEQVAEVLDRTGGKLGALAMRDAFFFWGTVPAYDVESIVELLADVVVNGVACDEDVIAERAIVLRRLAEMENDGERVVMDWLATMAYQGTELGRSIYPETKVVENLRAEAVESFRKRLFQPRLMTMISTGGTSLRETKDLAEKYFSGTGSAQNNCPMEDCCRPEKQKRTVFFRFTGGDFRLRDDDESLGHAALAIEGPGHFDCEDHCALTVAKEIVGSWDPTYGGSMNNSPHIARHAFDGDVCNSYKSFNIGWATTSLWGCYFSCEKMQLEDMTWMIQNEWMRLCGGITRKEVDRAVNQCKTRELVRINDSVDRFFDIGSCLHRRGSYDSLANRICRYENVTVEKLRQVANKYIYDQCPVVAAVGPIENLPDYNNIRSYMYRIRH